MLEGRSGVSANFVVKYHITTPKRWPSGISYNYAPGVRYHQAAKFDPFVMHSVFVDVLLGWFVFGLQPPSEIVS
jgi:hypothetical protein